jgi:outer membrane lipoprotein SlyB
MGFLSRRRAVVARDIRSRSNEENTMIQTRHVIALSAVAAALLGACAPYEQGPAYGPPGPPPPERGYVTQPVAYNTGVITSIDQMRAEQQRVSPVGAIAGAVIGGFLGNQVGAGGGKAAATVAGVAAGGLVGNEVGRRAEAGSTPDIFRIGIRYDGGGHQYFDVSYPGDLRPGDRVRVEGNGQISRY